MGIYFRNAPKIIETLIMHYKGCALMIKEKVTPNLRLKFFHIIEYQQFITCCAHLT